MSEFLKIYSINRLDYIEDFTKKINLSLQGEFNYINNIDNLNKFLTQINKRL